MNAMAKGIFQRLFIFATLQFKLPIEIRMFEIVNMFSERCKHEQTGILPLPTLRKRSITQQFI